MTAAFGDPVWASRRSGAYDAQWDDGCDLVVVGAGILGLSTALHAARHGLLVRVVEAGHIGGGASGLNGGQVIPGLKYDPDWLIAHFGEKRGGALVDFAASTADSVFKLIETEKLDVPHTRTGWIQAAHTGTALAGARERGRQWRARGVDCAMLDAGDIEKLTGARGYLGGWLDRRAGVIDPVAYTHELARLCVEAGAKITTNGRVAKLSRDNGVWRAVTEHGESTSAKSAVVATNAYSDGLVPGLAG